jgi:uncharacterized membrane protein
MESDRPIDPDEEPRPPGPGLGAGLGSLLPPEADDDEAGASNEFTRSDSSEEPYRSDKPHNSDLNDAVHRILVVGLLLSTALLLIGLVLDLLTAQALPSAALLPAEAFQRVLELNPSGFLSLGLLALMFTPVVRVIGSIVVFLWERDWLYFGVTVFVFTIMLLSVIFGRV